MDDEEWGWMVRGYRGVYKNKDLPYKQEEKVQFQSGLGWESPTVAALRGQAKPGGPTTAVLEVSGRALFLTAERDLLKGGIEFNLIDLKAEAAVVAEHHDWSNAPVRPPPMASVFLAPFPMAARLNDPTFHGSTLVPGPASPDVLIGGAPAWRAIVDQHVCPCCTPTPHGVGPTLPNGTTDVFVNGFPAARAGDVVLEPMGGANPIAVGCPTVLVGAPAPPVACTVHAPPPQDNRIFRMDMDIELDAGYARGELKGGLKVSDEDLRSLHAKFGWVCSGIRIRPKGTLGVRIPYTNYVQDISFDGAIHLFTIGGERAWDRSAGWKPIPRTSGWVGFEVSEVGLV